MILITNFVGRKATSRFMALPLCSIPLTGPRCRPFLTQSFSQPKTTWITY